MTVTRTPLCTVKGCPAPNDPDWHIPWCQDIPGHECFGGATHQHVPKRSQGGKKIVACLCAGAHDRIDNGTDWGNAVVPKEDGTLAYWAFDLHGKTLIERALPRSLSDGAEGTAGSAVVHSTAEGQGNAPDSQQRQAKNLSVAPNLLADLQFVHGQGKEARDPSAPSLKEEGAAVMFGTMQKITRRIKEESDGVGSGIVGSGAATDSVHVEPLDKGAPLDISDSSRGGDTCDERGDTLSPLTHEQRVAITQEIKESEWQRQWRAGDTANAWRAELGEEAEQYICDFGYVQESMANIMYTCESIPKNMRRAGLRFSHHVVMLGLNREDMEMWLDKCEEEQWGVAEFRRQVKGTKPKVKRWTLGELEEAVTDFEAWINTTNPPKSNTARSFVNFITPIG